MVSNSKNKILATWEPFFCRTLYIKISKNFTRSIPVLYATSEGLHLRVVDTNFSGLDEVISNMFPTKFTSNLHIVTHMKLKDGELRGALKTLR